MLSWSRRCPRGVWTVPSLTEIVELDSTTPLNHPMSHPVKTELTYNPRRNYGFSPQWYSRPDQDLHFPGLVLNHRNQLKMVHVSQSADRKHSHSAENRDSSLFQESDKVSSKENLFSKNWSFQGTEKAFDREPY